MAAKYALRAAGVSAALSGYGVYRYRTDEGFERTIRLWGSLGPAVAHYRLVEFKHKVLPPASKAAADAEWTVLHDRYCSPTVEALRQLQGMYTKYGQIAAGLSDTFPKVWLDELRTLEDKVPAQPKEVVLQTLREEYGREPSELFSDFDDVPLGSASIGQVHRARLRDGTEVAVKVQYPHSLRLFTGDMRTIRAFMEVAAPEQVITLSEMESMFADEFNYRHEADNLLQVDANMRAGGFVPSVAVVPLPYKELCTQRVLVMDLLHGKKLVDGIREFVAVVAAKDGKSVEQFEKEQADIIERDGLPPMYQGPSRLTLTLYKQYLRACDVLSNALPCCYNWLWGHWAGTPRPYGWSKVPVNTPQLVEDLMAVHAKQLFRDGCFNADPHAGNFLLLDDNRLGLIDFGATKRLTRGERLSACAVYVALKRRDRDTIKNIAIAGGFKSKHMKMENIFALVEFGFDSFGSDVTGGKNVQQFIDDLYRDDPWTESAGNLVMAQFLAIRLRSMFMQMGHPVRMSHYWGDYAEQVLKDEGCPYELWTLEYAEEVMKADLRIVKG